MSRSRPNAMIAFQPSSEIQALQRARLAVVHRRGNTLRSYDDRGDQEPKESTAVAPQILYRAACLVAALLDRWHSIDNVAFFVPLCCALFFFSDVGRLHSQFFRTLHILQVASSSSHIVWLNHAHPHTHDAFVQQLGQDLNLHRGATSMGSTRRVDE